jgi:serine/threonine protein kinase
MDNIGISPGTIIDGKYRVERMIGHGGMGAVYEVTHVELLRKAAIKTLLPEYVGNENLIKRFRQEAFMAASIGHDNICEVTDIGTTEDGSIYLLMPLLKGESFEELLGRKKVTISTVCDILAQTLSALEAAHNADIVHRDLKPDNIFITTVGDRNNFVKLLDFGISKIVNRETMDKLTQTGVMLGTPYYMSPEQAKGGDIDRRADIYAIGVILYEALTGVCPFEGSSYNQVMFKILVGTCEPPSKINQSITGPVEQIIQKAMALNLEDRYFSAAKMRDALKVAVSGKWSEPPSNVRMSKPSPLEHLSEPPAPRESATPATWTVDSKGHKGKKSGFWSKKTAVYAALGVIVVLLGMVGYLLTLKPTGQPLVPAEIAPVRMPVPVEILPEPAESSEKIAPGKTLETVSDDLAQGAGGMSESKNKNKKEEDDDEK